MEVPFLKLLGVNLISYGGGLSEISLTIEDKHTNSLGVSHGGVLLTLVDVGMAIAARSADPYDRSVVTVELKNNFLNVGEGYLIVKSNALQNSATLAFCEAQVFNEKGKLVSMATGTFKYLKNSK